MYLSPLLSAASLNISNPKLYSADPSLLFSRIVSNDPNIDNGTSSSSISNVNGLWFSLAIPKRSTFPPLLMKTKYSIKFLFPKCPEMDLM